MGKVSEKFIIGALGFSLFDNKKFRERIRQEVREAVADILLNTREEKKWRDHYNEKILAEREALEETRDALIKEKEDKQKNRSGFTNFLKGTVMGETGEIDKQIKKINEELGKKREDLPTNDEEAKRAYEEDLIAEGVPTEEAKKLTKEMILCIDYTKKV